MTEPGVALTDYAVALECALLAVLLPRGRTRAGSLRPWFLLFFLSMGVASILGGTVHGFFLDGRSSAHAVLWTLTLLAMGLTAFSIWSIGAALLFSKPFVRWVLVAAGVQFGLYSVVVLLLTQKFWVGIVDSVPAVLFLLVAILLTYRREKRKSILPAAAGLVLFLVAAFLQHLQIGIDPVYFNHNTLYHTLQAAALFLFYRGGHWLLATESVRPVAKGPDVGSGELAIGNDKP